MPQSWLPEGGQNLFQRIKAQRAAAEKAGVSILNLAIGQPQGPALMSARIGASQAVLSEEESMHEYQDNSSPGVPEFAREFVEFHTGALLEDVAFLPTPGTKSMLGLIPLACNCQAAAGDLRVYTTTEPGYPTPADWCHYLGVVGHRRLRLGPENNFRFSLARILEVERIPSTTPVLVMMNYPHNPSGQIATRFWLRELCGICVANGFRLFNDAAYIALKHTSEFCCSLAEVAAGFPELSWAEAYSASKLIGNGTGWRIGALAGSADFITDIARVKGNTDSGFAAPLAAGVLYAIRHDHAGIDACRVKYGLRIEVLINILQGKNMQLAVRPGAGFFTLWMAPTYAFGERIRNGEEFNNLMIERTGVVGVPFGPYIRYAVVGDIEAMAQEISHAFSQANVGYEVKIV